ncbi:hypothetical protein NXT3_PC00851 (plasmid) [Sinorhizobium fredii]|uniref:Uncharacterized protein n=1 Tax=Rhizobium fredii TaxID=380 RepID=A0A2L0HET7_RHIFR|nr:hypothetical protein NXT3_PC00851 [Sinorhizobium fredii]
MSTRILLTDAFSSDIMVSHNMRLGRNRQDRIEIAHLPQVLAERERPHERV